MDPLQDNVEDVAFDKVNEDPLAAVNDVAAVNAVADPNVDDVNLDEMSAIGDVKNADEAAVDSNSDFVHVESLDAFESSKENETSKSGLEGLNLGRANPLVREEPESLVKWRKEQQQRLRDKDQEEQEQMSKLREQAKKELKDWHAKYEDQVSKLRESNRASEKSFVSSLNGGSDDFDGKEWERVAKMCDFTEKARKPSAKDVSRMRSILLNLKQNPVQRREN